ncbi:MAG: hypothetical protein AAGD10_20075 [Myxococcota bacterium]
MNYRLGRLLLGAALAPWACGDSVDCLALCQSNFDQLALQFGVRRPCLEEERFELADTCFECAAVLQELYFAPIDELDNPSSCRD